MRATLPLSLLLASLALPAWGQTAGKPLNLKLPPSDLPVASSTARTPAHAPGVYYGDTSGRTDYTNEAETTDDCDDATFNQPQVHGSVSTGVVSGSHVGTGTWNAGTVNISKAFGDCGHPSGGVSISVGASSGHFHDRGH